ncbi:unnamed protein product [Lota lota]
MYHSVDCRPAVSSSQQRTLRSPRNGFKKDWPIVSPSSSSTTTRSNRTSQSQLVGPGGSRFTRDFRRRTLLNFTPLHDSPPTNRASLGPNPQTSEQTKVYTAEKRGDISDEHCTPLKLRFGPGGVSLAGQTETSGPNGGYQDVSAVSSPPGSSQLKERGLGGSNPEQSWLRQDPLVECGPEAMTLRIRRRRAGQLLLDRGNGSALALSQLTADCGFSLQTSGRDLALTAPYHGCDVALEGDSYVLKLLWRGVPVKMFCPAPRSSHCCSALGMTVILHGLPASAQLHVKVRGEWTPVLELALKCGYTLHRQAQDLLVEVPFITCGVSVEDGNYSLSLQIGEQEVMLTCPVSQEESPQPPPWVPPFYLAPPYYPHPAYPSSTPVFRSYDTFQPPTQPSLTIRPPAWLVRPGRFEPQPVDQNHASYQRSPTTNSYPGTHVPNPPLVTLEEPGDWKWADQSQRPDPLTSRPSEDPPPPSFPTSSPGHAEEAGLQPPSSSNQYYHYYHLPKIPLPLPSPPPRPHSGPRSQNAPIGYFEFLQQMVQAAASQLDYMDQDSSHRDARNNPNPPYRIPETPLYQYQQPDRAPVATTSSPALSQTRGTGTAMRPPLSIPHYPLQHANFYANSFLRQEVPHNPSQHEEVGSRQETQDEAEMVSTACQQGLKSENSDQRPEDVNQEHGSVTPTPPFLPPMYPFFDYPPHQPMYPFYDYPPFQPNWRTKQHVPSPTTPPLTTTQSTTPTPTATPSPHFPGNLLQNVYYHPFGFYHNLYDGQQPSDPPSPSRDHRGSPKVPPEQPSQTSGSPTKLDTPVDPDPLDRHQYSDANDPSMDNTQLIPHTEDQQASSTIIESTSDADEFAPNHYYQYYQPNEPLVGDDSGRETSVLNGQVYPDSAFDLEQFFAATEDGYVGMDQYQSMSYHSALNPDITAKQDWYGPFQLLDMKAQGWQDCAMGQHLIFLVPDFVEGPTVLSDGETSDSSNASCTPQRLPWNPQLYGVPLHGCGVRTQASEDTVYLLELQAILTLPGDPAPLQGIPATEPPLVIQTRISTDASFTEFFPELHRPLSSLQGRPLYLEVRVLGMGSRLLVHYCLAYTQTPHPAWMLLYYGCWNQTPPDPSQPPPSALRITVPHFLALLPSFQPPSDGPSNMKDTEVFFLCYSQVCSDAADCSLHCTGCESRTHN